MRTACRKVILSIVLLSSFAAHAELGKETIGHVTVGAGLQWAVTSLRIGRNDWELGRLNFYSLGVVAHQRWDSLYSGMGIVATPVNNNLMMPGIFAPLGYEAKWLSWLHFRAELNGSVFFNGKTWGEISLALVGGF
jgi:hypothetical protein